MERPPSPSRTAEAQTRKVWSELVDAVRDEVGSPIDRYDGLAEARLLHGPRAYGEALRDPDAIRRLARLLRERIGPEYLTSARRLGSDADVESSAQRIATRARGPEAYAEALQHQSPAALTAKTRLSVSEAHKKLAAAQRE